MDARTHFRRLFDHDVWANRQVIAHLRELPEPPPQTVELMSHIVACGFLWLGRLGQTDEQVPVWPATGLEACAAHCDGTDQLWRRLIATLTGEGLAASITYTNSRGAEYESSVEDVLDHVLQHAAYHRGQIATRLRQARIDPPLVDLIHSTRSGLLD